MEGGKKLGRWEREGLCIGRRGVADLTTLCDSGLEGGWGTGENTRLQGKLQLQMGQCSNFGPS